MPSNQKEQLFTLVKALNKAEKRNFKLYATRSQSGVDSKFVQLFDVLDKLDDYDEQVIIDKLPGVKKRHLSNLKRNLYKQILISLRLIHIQKNIDIQIREQLDFARILYGKGMYMQSLRILERIKTVAIDHHQDLLHLEILEFQKLIEARHITRSRAIENKMEALLEDSERRSFISHQASLLSNLNISIHGHYIDSGHCRSPEDIQKLNAQYEEYLANASKRKDLTFFEKVNLYQSYMWYYYIQLDFDNSYIYAYEWVRLYQDFPQMQEKDPDLYMRGLYYYQTFAFFLQKKAILDHQLQALDQFLQEHKNLLNENSQMIAFVYCNLSRLNKYIMEGNYGKGIALIPGIKKGIRQYQSLIDEHRIFLFYYKFACLYFGTGQINNAIDYINEILNQRSTFLREDLHHNIRLLQVLCHYELSNFELLSYLVPSTQRTYNKSREVNQLQVETISFIKSILNLSEREKNQAFHDFQDRIKKLRENPYESKAFNYLEIPKWIESQLEGCTIADLFSKVKTDKPNTTLI